MGNSFVKSFLFAVGVVGAVWLLFSLVQSDGPLVVASVVREKTSAVIAASVLPITPPHLPLHKGRKGEVITGEKEGATEEEVQNVTIVTKQNNTTVFVTRVVDGDTIEIEGGEKVRYIGVNTPESVDPRRKVQCFGKEASAYNKKLVEGKRVRLGADLEDRDRYRRLLRYVWLGDTMINEKLVQDGYAQVMTIPPNVKYADRFRVAQTEAREAKQGLWGKCRK